MGYTDDMQHIFQSWGWVLSKMNVTNFSQMRHRASVQTAYPSLPQTKKSFRVIKQIWNITGFDPYHLNPLCVNLSNINLQCLRWNFPIHKGYRILFVEQGWQCLSGMCTHRPWVVLKHLPTFLTHFFIFTLYILFFKFGPWHQFRIKTSV